MREGACPKCDSTDVFMRRSGLKWRLAEPRVEIMYPGLVGKHKLSKYEAYVCTHCGYFETYLLSPRALAKIARKWQRVVPGETTRPVLATEDDEGEPRRREPTLAEPSGGAVVPSGDEPTPAGGPGAKKPGFFARALGAMKSAGRALGALTDKLKFKR